MSGLIDGMRRKKIVLVIHGFPGLPEEYGVRDYIKQRGHEGIIPDIFENSINFDNEGVQKLIESKLAGKKPDVIIAFFIGGA